MTHKDLQNKDYAAWLKFLREADSWSSGQIKEYELSEIKRVTKHAYENTGGYRKLFEQVGINPEEIDSIETFRKIPLTTKEMFQNSLDEFSCDFPGRYYVTTGGSTGIPMGMYRDPVSFAKELASKAHQYYRIGWNEEDRQMVLRGLPINTFDHTEFVADFNELRCSTYQFVPEIMEQYLQKAFEYKPDWLRCYPSAGYLFAGFLEERKLDFPKLKGVLCASEMLFDSQKQRLEEVFKCRVFSHYGHYEMAALAGFCEFTDDYHVLPQYGFVELINDNGNLVTEAGETGEIVATSFIMNATPFIRYKTGDLAKLKGWECESCRRPYQIWEKVIGRRQEMIVSRNDRLISMTMLNMHDDIYDHLRQYQFYQSEKGKVEFRFEPKDTLTNAMIEDIQKRLYLKLGTDIELRMMPVKQIELTKRGKHRTLVQKLELNFDNEERTNG